MAPIAGITAEIREEIAKGGTNEAIADWLGCSAQHVADVRRQDKVRARKNKNGLNRRQTREAVALRIENGQRNVDIARRVGCSEDLVARIRRQIKEVEPVPEVVDDEVLMKPEEVARKLNVKLRTLYAMMAPGGTLHHLRVTLGHKTIRVRPSALEAHIRATR